MTPNIEYIALVLGDYCDLQIDGIVPAANRYPVADVMEQVDLLGHLQPVANEVLARRIAELERQLSTAQSMHVDNVRHIWESRNCGSCSELAEKHDALVAQVEMLRMVISPKVLDLIRCGIGSNYGGSKFDEAMKKYHDPVLDALSATSSACLAQGRVSYQSTSIADHLVRQITFSLKAFGPALRTGGIIDHIGKELKEVAENPHDLSEWIDIAMLALDGAWRHAVRGGRTHEDIAQEVAAVLQVKLVKNENRTWPDWRLLSEDKAIEHDRTGESAGKVGE